MQDTVSLVNRYIPYLVLACLLIVPGVGGAQTPAGLGSPCQAGQYAHSGYLLVCADTGRFRYALHEDVPPAPEGGYVERPSWFPAINSVFRATTNAPQCPLSGRVTFTSPVIRSEDLIVTVPQGMVAGDHVTPIDHGYIGVKPLAKPRAARTEADYVRITAPADGEVIEVSSLGSPTSMRVVLAHGCDTYSIYMVINRLSGALAHLQDDVQRGGSLSPRIRILAGEEFGMQRDNPLDFSVHDGASWLPGFLAPFSYTSSDTWKPYTVDPWPYFSPDLAAAYEASLQRLSAPRWGRIDQDVAHTASGNWFLDGTVGYSGRSVETVRNATSPLMGGPIPGKNSPAWSHLSFLRHWVQPSRSLLSIGWWRDERGDPAQFLVDVAAGQPHPSSLTVDSGIVVYRLRTWLASPGLTNDGPAPIGYDVVPGPTILGLVAVQVNADETLTIEPMPGAQDPATFKGFTTAKRTYRR